MIEIDMGRVFMRLGNYEFEIVVPEPATAEGTADLLRECLSRCVITHTYKPIPVPPGYVPVPGGLVDSLTGGPAPIPPEATGSNANSGQAS